MLCFAVLVDGSVPTGCRWDDKGTIALACPSVS